MKTARPLLKYGRLKTWPANSSSFLLAQRCPSEPISDQTMLWFTVKVGNRCLSKRMLVINGLTDGSGKYRSRKKLSVKTVSTGCAYFFGWVQQVFAVTLPPHVLWTCREQKFHVINDLSHRKLHQSYQYISDRLYCRSERTARCSAFVLFRFNRFIVFHEKPIYGASPAI